VKNLGLITSFAVGFLGMDPDELEGSDDEGDAANANGNSF
jgi:hypothetical protein